jgi:dTMP kinase
MAGRSGAFITFEGGEGAGKTTQIRLLREALEAQGREVVVTREPGGTKEAEKIRTLIVDRDGGAWTPMAECLLLFAGRLMHVETLIKPALAEGKIVLCDRFADSTLAYQSYGHGVPREDVAALYKLSLGDFRPDLTFIFDIAPAQGLTRAGKRLAGEGSSEDRFERLGADFHERLRAGYREIAAREPQRCRLIDAGRGVDEIAAELAAATSAFLRGAFLTGPADV